MKVQIQYRIELDEVPNKISQLVDEALTELQDQIDTMRSLNELCKQGVHLGAVESGIDAIRKQLSLSDAALSDAHSICAGLISHLNPEPEVAQPPSAPAMAEELPDQPEPTMEDEPSSPVEKK